jgi:hypothetical protein
MPVQNNKCLSHSKFFRSSSSFSYYTAPDGGWGWVIVAASFLVNMIADGVTFSFGVLFVEFQVNVWDNDVPQISTLFILCNSRKVSLTE